MLIACSLNGAPECQTPPSPPRRCRCLEMGRRQRPTWPAGTGCWCITVESPTWRRLPIFGESPADRLRRDLRDDAAFNAYPDGAYHLLGNSTAELIEPYPAKSFDATSWQRDAAYGESQGWPWNRVSKKTRMRAYIEAIETIQHRPVEGPAQRDLFAPPRRFEMARVAC